MSLDYRDIFTLNHVLSYIAAELYFITGTYEFYEDQGLVCINLTLNKPAPCNMTVEVIEESGSATSELCSYACIYVICM